MADKAIGSLTAGTKPDGTEIMHGVQSSNSRQFTLRQIAEIGLEITTEVTDYTAVIGDNGKYIKFNSLTDIEFTIDDSIFSAGDEITFEQMNTGTVTVVAGTGVTINSRGSRVETNGQFSVASLKFTAADEATLFGDLV